MTTSTDRAQYRALVAEVAARAKERLPQAVNGRIESAVKPVLLHDIEPQADGTIEVGSSSDPLKTYRLQGTACECQDFTSGRAPESWCKHRIAAGIDKRVREVLAMPPDPEPEPAQESVQVAQKPVQAVQESVHPALPEAPASVNCHLTIAGRQVQLTLRDSDETRLLGRLAAVLAQYPLPEPAKAQLPAPPASQAEGWCALHHTALHLNHGKDGRTWYSHKLAEGGFCKGRK